MPCTNIYPEILDWSPSRPEWQRDALRRLVIAPNLTEKDIEELKTLCKESHGLREEKKPKLKAEPLKPEHIPCITPQDIPVRIKAISDVKNVNAIQSQNPLTFIENGLTVIYGDNGSGKSGYVRILKNICRAKDKPQILPDAFSTGQKEPPSAKIVYKNGDIEKSIDWQLSKMPPPELSCINIFDSECASIYVNKENEIAYAPLGLDIFDKLAKACDKINEDLSSEMRALIPKIEQLPPELEGTETGKWFKGIEPKITSEDIETHIAFTEENKSRLDLLKRVLTQDRPKKKAVELRSKKARYDQLLTRITAISNVLSGAEAKKLQTAKTNLDTATETAKLASKEAFSEEQEPGAGKNAWYELWKAAKEFSESEVYPATPFPNTGPGAKCVLCYQELKDEALVRLERFKIFIQDDAVSKKEDSEKKFKETLTEFTSLKISHETDNNLLTELGNDDKTLREETAEFLKSAQERKETLITACQDKKWESVKQLTKSPAEKLQLLSQQLNEEADALDKSEDPEEFKIMQAKANELSAKRWVSSRKEQIIKEIDRQKTVQKYEKAIKQTNTTKITNKSSDLTEKYITDEVKKQFSETLDFLYDGKLKIAWEKKRGGKAVTYFTLNLTDCILPDAKASQIISEGEFKAVALAEFFTDISLLPGKPGIILDDPVTSFDHKIREKVAEKIVQLAKERQVIVFTHDIYLLVNLLDMAKRAGVNTYSEQQLLKEYWGSGVCIHDSPWEAASVNARIRKINDLTQKAIPKYKRGTAEYQPFVLDLCSRMRQTVERALEDILISEIVQRYRKNVQITQVKSLLKIEEKDCTFIESLWAKYSTPLHDHREGNPVTWPSPQDIQKDADQLKAWVREFEERK